MIVDVRTMTGQVCRRPGCGAPLEFAATEAGRPMPVDPDPYDGADERANLAVMRDAAGRLPHRYRSSPSTKGPPMSNYAISHVQRVDDRVEATVSRDLSEPEHGRIRLTLVDDVRVDTEGTVTAQLDRAGAVELAIAIIEATEPHFIGADRLNADLLLLGVAFLALRSNLGVDVRVERVDPMRVTVTA